MNALIVSKRLEEKGELRFFKRDSLDTKHTIVVTDGLVYVDKEPMTWDSFTYLWLKRIGIYG